MFPLQFMFKRRQRQGSAISCAILATVILSTTIVAFMSSAAFAKDPAPNIQLVRHADLNLASEKDVAKLHHRIDRATKNLCSRPGVASKILKRQVNDCVDETKVQALRNLEQKIAILAPAMRPKSRN